MKRLQKVIFVVLLFTIICSCASCTLKSKVSEANLSKVEQTAENFAKSYAIENADEGLLFNGIYEYEEKSLGKTKTYYCIYKDGIYDGCVYEDITLSEAKAYFEPLASGYYWLEAEDSYSEGKVYFVIKSE